MSAYAIATLWLLAKVAVGTAVFLSILAVGQLLDGRAAGLMVTFPALNGMGLLAAEDLDRVALDLFPAIALNGLLCAGCIAVYRRSAAVRTNHRLRAAMPYPALAFWAAVLPLVLWIGGAVNSPIALIAGYAIVAFALAAIGASRPAPRPHPETAPRAFWSANRHRIALFVASLVAVLIAAQFWQNALGWLAALPLVPLFGIAGIAEERPDKLEEMQCTAVLGPLLAMIFVLLLWQSLILLRANVGGPALLPYSALACLVGWIACVAVIAGSSALDRKRGPRTA
jgi:hypothetical protein